jgi:hypothetical protein
VILCRHSDTDCRPFFLGVAQPHTNATALGSVAVKEQDAGIQIKRRR